MISAFGSRGFGENGHFCNRSATLVKQAGRGRRRLLRKRGIVRGGNDRRGAAHGLELFDSGVCILSDARNEFVKKRIGRGRGRRRIFLRRVHSWRGGRRKKFGPGFGYKTRNEISIDRARKGILFDRFERRRSKRRRIDERRRRR